MNGRNVAANAPCDQQMSVCVINDREDIQVKLKIRER